MEALAYVDLRTATPDEIASLYEEGMQVRLTEDGPWHRCTIERHATACGQQVRPVPAMGWGAAALRRDEYSGPLCPDCFTPFERSIGEYQDKQRQEGLERIRTIPDSSNPNPGDDNG
jgi:hypothetical protein